MKATVYRMIAGALLACCASAQAEEALDEPLDKAPAVSSALRLSDAQLDEITAGAPWYVWMGVGALGVVALDAHTNVIGQLGHGCRGVNCNNLP